MYNGIILTLLMYSIKYLNTPFLPSRSLLDNITGCLHLSKKILIIYFPFFMLIFFCFTIIFWVGILLFFVCFLPTYFDTYFFHIYSLFMFFSSLDNPLYLFFASSSKLFLLFSYLLPQFSIFFFSLFL